MSGKVLGRALRIEDEPVRDQIDRREVRLEPGTPELREVGVHWEPEDALEHGRKDRLREQLLVLAGAGLVQVLAEIPAAVELAVASVLLVEHGFQGGERW